MDFLKKHYEKVILAFFLIAFVLLLLYLIDLGNSTREISNEQLQIPIIEPNYKKNNFSLQKYQTNYIFEKNCVWNKSIARDKKNQIFTDLMIPFKCARCPFGNKVIPRYYFLGPIDNLRSCPLCKKKLKRPIIVQVTGGGNSGTDMDDDGLPNVIEIKLGLDQDNPDDALYDMDGDGFTNIFEFRQETNINKATSKPPMYMRLHLLEFKETLLPFQLMLVNTNGGKKDPADWTIQINETIKRKIKTRFKYLDSRMELDKTPYTIIKIDARHVDKRQGGSIVKIDKSKVYLKSKDGKYTITMQVGKPVYSPKPKAAIEDLGTGKMYNVGEDDIISMYLRTKRAVSKKTGRKLKRKITRYKVLKVDRQKKQVIIEETKKRNPKKYVLTAKAFMPRPVKKQEGTVSGRDSGIGESIDAPPGGAPPSATGRTTRTRRQPRRNF